MGCFKKAKGLISAIIIALFVSVCLTGCGKGKKEETPPAVATSASEEVMIPEPPGEPIIETGDEQQPGPAQQNQPIQQGSGQNAPDETIIINNNPPALGAAAGAGSGAGAAPWWNPWGGNQPQGNNPGNPPQAQDFEGIIVYSVAFIPDDGSGPVNETTVGQSGTICGYFSNKYNSAKNLRGRIKVGAETKRDEVVAYPADSQPVFKARHTFTAEGTYQLWFSIDGLSDEDRTRNAASFPILVKPGAQPDAGGQGGNQGASTVPDLAIVKLGYVRPGTNEVVDTAFTDELGTIRAVIDNRSNQGVSAAYAVLGLNMMQLKNQAIPMGPYGTASVDVPRKFTSAGDYDLNVDVYPDGTQASRKNLTAKLHVKHTLPVHPVKPPRPTMTGKGPEVSHDVVGTIRLVNSTGRETTGVTDKETCFIEWTVGSVTREPSNGVDISVYVDNDRKDHKVVDIGPNPAGTSGLVYNVKFPADNHPHSILLSIDDDKRIKKDIAVTRAETEHYNVEGSLILKSQNGTMPIFYDDVNMYKIEYTIKNNGREEIRGLPMQIKINDTPKRERDIYMGPSPAKITQHIDNVAFDRAGRHVIKMKLGEDFKCELPVEVVSRERQWRYPTGAIALYNSREQEVTRVAINENCKIKYTLGNGYPREAILNVHCRVTVDDDVKADTKIDLHTGVRERSLWIENIKFLQPGPHTIMLAWLRQDPVEGHEDVVEVESHVQEIITAIDESGLGEAHHNQTSSEGSGPKMLTREVDAKAIDIGFIPEGARDYYDVITAGKRGAIYAAYDNASSQEIRDLRMQVLVDGNVVRESVKGSIGPGQRATVTVSPYWFNEGRHKISLILDPKGEIKETDEKNNKITNTVTVVPRQQPQRYDYSTPAVSGFFDNLGNLGNNDGGSTPPPISPPTYKPPRTTPTFTTYGGDQASSSSSATTTTAKKKTPFTVKGLGQ